MILKLHAYLLALPMLAVNAKRSQVMHSSGRKRHEARVAKHALAQTKQVGVKSDLKEDVGCEEQGGGCWWDSQCCSGMECLGVLTWQCGNTPGHKGEFCNLMYPCDPDLSCYQDLCTDYADILDRGEYEGTCKKGSSPGQLTVMTYNTFLISCFTGGDSDIPCQSPADRAERVGRMMEWVQTRDEDVIVFQELFNSHDEVIEGMVAAGFCHYVISPFEGHGGDGLATFSKYPIGEIDFWDFYDFMGENSESTGLQYGTIYETIMFDKGFMYAEIKKGGRSHHIYNVHTLSDSVTDMHLRRMGQYLAMREASEGKSAGDLVLFAGDTNENKYNEHVGEKYYRNMLVELNATEPRTEGDEKYTYDNVKNPLPAIYYPPDDKVYKELLDYVLVSNAHLQPSDSFCEILTPLWPENCDGSISCQVSDHYPVTCTYVFGGPNVALE